MLVQMIKELRLKPSIASYGLLATNFKSCDAALSFLMDIDDDQASVTGTLGKIRHPYIGCLPLTNNSTNNHDQIEFDLEA